MLANLTDSTHTEMSKNVILQVEPLAARVSSRNLYRTHFLPSLFKKAFLGYLQQIADTVSTFFKPNLLSFLTYTRRMIIRIEELR